MLLTINNRHNLSNTCVYVCMYVYVCVHLGETISTKIEVVVPPGKYHFCFSVKYAQVRMCRESSLLFT